MIEIFNQIIHTFGSYSALKAVISYEKKRDGANMLYRFNYKIFISDRNGDHYAYGNYNNELKAEFTLNGVKAWEKETKSTDKGWSFEDTSNWFTVKDKTTGTTSFKFTIKDTINSGWCNYTSGTFNLEIDPAGSVLNSISDFNIGNSIPISITKYSSNFTDNLVISYESTTIKTINDISNGDKVSFSNSELSKIYSLMEKVKTGTFTFVLTSKSGSSTIGTSTKTASCNITDANPTFTAKQITYLDSNDSIVAITDNNQYIVRNLSNLKITCASATGNKGAKISKYEITFNGSTKNLDSAGTVDFGTINYSRNLTIDVRVIDSRGNSTNASKEVVILDWVLPSAVISAKRVNNYEDDTKLRVQVSISSVNSINSIQSIKYRYKKTSSSSFSEYFSLTNNVEETLILDKLYAWDFQVVIKDKFGTKQYNFVVAKGFPIMFIDVVLKSVGVNCFPTKENSFEVNGYDFENLHPVGSTFLSTENVNPSTYMSGEWGLLSSGKFFSGVDTTFYLWNRTS